MKRLVLAASLFIASCGKPVDVARCEADLRTLVPGAGRILSTVRRDSGPLSPAAFDRVAGIGEPVSSLDAAARDVRAQEAVGHRIQLRQLTLVVATPAGKQAHTCAFRVVDGQVQEDQSALDASLAEYRSSQRTIDAWQGKGKLPVPERRSCCL